MAVGETNPGSTMDMAASDHGHALVHSGSDDLPLGSVVTASGRVSAAEVFTEPDLSGLPFTPVQLSRLDEALTLASRDSGLRFSVFLGDLGGKATDTAQRLHGQMEGSDESVRVAVSPEQRVVEVVTGPEARVRLPDRGGPPGLEALGGQRDGQRRADQVVIVDDQDARGPLRARGLLGHDARSVGTGLVRRSLTSDQRARPARGAVSGWRLRWGRRRRVPSSAAA